jgi:methyl-accepting chemotaxis protein
MSSLLSKNSSNWWWQRIMRTSVKNKILVSSLVLAVLPVIAANTFLGERAINKGTTIATDQAHQLLGALRDTKKTQLINYFDGLKNELSAIAGSSGTAQAEINFNDTLMDYSDDYGDREPPTALELKGYRKQLLSYYSGEYSEVFTQKSAGESLNMKALASGLDDVATALQFRYIKSNSLPVDEKEKLLEPISDQLPYDVFHKQNHPGYHKLINKLGFRDLYLVDAASSRIVYSVKKGSDYAMKLSGTALEQTPIGKLYQRLKENPSLEFAVENFTDYGPAYHALTGFAGVPIYETVAKDNTLRNIKSNAFYGQRLVGYLIVQLSDSVITDILTNHQGWANVGLGKTGEVYLINKDNKLASDVRPFLENQETFAARMKQKGVSDAVLDHMRTNGSSTGQLEINSASTKQALQGQSGIINESNYLGNEVVTAFTPISVYGLNWAILAQMSLRAAMAPVVALDQAISNTAWMVALIVIFIAIILAILLARQLTRPLGMIESTVNQLNQGYYNARCQVKTGDEYQSLGDAINAMVDERAEFLRSEEASKTLNKNIIQVLEAVSELSERNLTVNVPVTEDIIGPVADSLNLMTEEISDMMRSVQKISDDVGTSSESLAHLADDVHSLSTEERQKLEHMVSRLAEASHSLTDISEVARHSNEIAQNARQHVQQAHNTVGRAASGMHDIREVIHETEKRIKRLGERSQEISGITDIINTIAERTHVLSINASIQAAAAGDAGRGFSVVAEEVQRLAESSRGATAQIATLVKNIQIETLDASETMARAIEQVVSGSQLADEAGRIMHESDLITEQLAEAMERIAKDSTDQANIGQTLRQDAENLRGKSEQTSEKIRAQHQETGQLTSFALQLRQSIGSFKLS